jgi:hypothetical protein
MDRRIIEQSNDLLNARNISRTRAAFVRRGLWNI